MRPRIGLVPLHAGCLHLQRAGVRYGFLGVDHQVHYHLLQLLGIGVDGIALRAERDTHLHVLPRQPLQHRPHLLNQTVDLQPARFENLLAAEGQQLLGQSRGAFPGPVDLLEVLPQRIARYQVAKQ